MSDLVQTKLGLLNRAELKVEDHMYEDGNARYVNTRWWYRGELVREDAWVNLKQGVSTEVKLG